MKNHPWKSERPVDDEVIHEVKNERDGEDLWIITMTKRSAKLTLFIGLLFASEHLLPAKVVEEPVLEFIFDSNTLKRARTASLEFAVAPDHTHPSFIGDHPIIIHSGPILKQVRHYTLVQENHEIEHYPHFSVNKHAYLMYIVLVFSMIQMIFNLDSFPRFAMWLLSIGCILGYMLVYLSSSL